MPVLKVRAVSATAMKQVPYEPAVPGTMTSHQTIGAHSVMAWFSPWQAKLIMAMVDQVLTHPVVNVLRQAEQQANEQQPAAAAVPAAASTAASAATPGATVTGMGISSHPSIAASTMGGSDAAAHDSSLCTPAGGSRVSLLVSVPLLMVNCYVELPTSLSRPDELYTSMMAMQQSG